MVRGICFLQLWIIWELSIRWQFFFFVVPLRNIFIFHMRSTLGQQGLKPLQGYTYCGLNMSNAGTEAGWGGQQHFSQPTKLYPVVFKKKDRGGGLWSTYVCIDHGIIFSVVSLSATTHSTTTSRCPHGFRARPSQELNLARTVKRSSFSSSTIVSNLFEQDDNLYYIKNMIYHCQKDTSLFKLCF